MLPDFPFETHPSPLKQDEEAGIQPDIADSGTTANPQDNGSLRSGIPGNIDGGNDDTISHGSQNQASGPDNVSENLGFDHDVGDHSLTTTQDPHNLASHYQIHDNQAQNTRIGYETRA